MWITYENLLLSCLRTGDEESAQECIERLVKRFGPDNERISAFRGLVREAKATNDAELEAILKDYDEILAENNTNIVSANDTMLAKGCSRLTVYSLSRNVASHCCVR